MPVYRFKDFEDARRALWTDANAPDLGQRIRKLWAFSTRLVSRRIPSGVRRFHSVEEANRQRATWGTSRPA